MKYRFPFHDPSETFEFVYLEFVIFTEYTFDYLI